MPTRDVRTHVLDAIARARKERKERKSEGGSRFLNNSAEAKARRRDRLTKRKRRSNKGKKTLGAKIVKKAVKRNQMGNRSGKVAKTALKQNRMGNRSGCLPCCGHRPERCKCWREESATEEDHQIMTMLDRTVLKNMIARIDKAEIQNASRTRRCLAASISSKIVSGPSSYIMTLSQGDLD